MEGPDWSTLVEDAEAEASGASRGKCGVKLLMTTLTEEQRAQIGAALARPDLPATAIMKAIKRRVKTQVSAEALRRHRRGACRCNENG